MKVSELIEELKKFPQDLIVADGSCEIDTLYLSEEFYLGDPANPKNEPVKAVVIL